MSTSSVATEAVRTASSTAADDDQATAQVLAQLEGFAAAAVIYFVSSSRDGAKVSAAIAARFDGIPVIGCTTAGEFTDHSNGTGGLVVIALPSSMVRRSAAALADFGDGVAVGIDQAVATIEERLRGRLRDLDPAQAVGLVLIDGLGGNEERVNELLGNAAPLLSVVGGSAGDDLAFETTSVWVDGRRTDNGAALLILDVTVPFAVVKTCSFEPTSATLTVTKADPRTRTVIEFDHRPAAQVYAESTGVTVEALDSAVFMTHPLGVMIDGKPWIRSPRAVTDEGLAFYCQTLVGMELSVMDATDLVADTRRALAETVRELGGEARGAVMFNCILRRLELDAAGAGDDFVHALGGMPLVGFHTYGESWLGHLNQTLVGIVFGAAPRS
jgi:hypothetical protein